MPNKSGKARKSELRAEIALQLAQILELREEVLELREWSCNGWAAASAEMNLKLEAHKTNSRLEAELRRLRGTWPVDVPSADYYSKLRRSDARMPTPPRPVTDVPLAAPSQWVQETLFENTEDGSNIARIGALCGALQEPGSANDCRRLTGHKGPHMGCGQSWQPPFSGMRCDACSITFLPGVLLCPTCKGELRLIPPLDLNAAEGAL